MYYWLLVASYYWLICSISFVESHCFIYTSWLLIAILVIKSTHSGKAFTSWLNLYHKYFSSIAASMSRFETWFVHERTFFFFRFDELEFGSSAGVPFIWLSWIGQSSTPQIITLQVSEWWNFLFLRKKKRTTLWTLFTSSTCFVLAMYFTAQIFEAKMWKFVLIESYFSGNWQPWVRWQWRNHFR